MDPEKYNEQMKWRQNVLEKAEGKKQEELDALNDLTFQPRFESKDAKVYRVDSHVTDLTMKAGNSYVERQLKAKKEKQEKTDKLNWRPGKAKKSLLSLSQEGLASFPGSPSTTRRASNEQDNIDPEDDGDRELTYEETLMEMLERERKEWHLERVKLVHCIYLQQMELTERAVAAQEKAAEIAKEFGLALMKFEQRLDSVETGVDKEVRAVRDIAENLLKAVAAEGIQPNSSTRSTISSPN